MPTPRRSSDLARTVGVVLQVWPGKARERDRIEKASVVCLTRCGFCPPEAPFEVEATVADGAALVRDHVEAIHPEEAHRFRGRPRPDTTRDDEPPS